MFYCYGNHETWCHKSLGDEAGTWRDNLCPWGTRKMPFREWIIDQPILLASKKVTSVFPECVARVPVSFGGLGVRLCSRKVVSMFATVHNRSQPSATVCVSAVRVSTVASAPGVIPKACEVESCRRSYIGVCRGGVCGSDLCRRSYIGVCRGGVCVSDLCRRSYFGVCRGGVCVSDLCRRSYIGVCRGGVCVSDLCRRSYIGVCRGGVCESDLCRRSYIGVCRGGV